MNYYFDDFVFNSQSLVLTKAGESLTIRHNESRLLAYFLENPENVLSKDAILENVWAGKVVSEQAVFQAISNLRALFGEDAIKTFPKKGYQWQIPFKSSLPQTGFKESIQQSNAGNYLLFKSRFSALVVLGCLLTISFLLTLIVFRNSPAVVQQPATIVIQPFVLDPTHSGNGDIARQLQDAVLKLLDDQIGIEGRLPPSHIQQTSQQVIASPAHFFNFYKESINANLLVTAKVRQQGNILYLFFILQGQENQWTGYLSGKNSSELATNFVELLSKVVPVKIVWEAKDRRLVNAQLQLLLSENPDNAPIHYQLIDNLLFLGDLQGAKIQAELLMQKSKNNENLPYQSLALMTKIMAGFDNVDPEKNVELLKQADALYEKFNDRVLLSRILERGTYIYYQQHDFVAMEKNLLRALDLAETAQAPEQQLQVLHALSIFSYKFKRIDKRDLYLERAKSILEKYQFPGENYAALEDISGMYTDDETQKERFFRQALNRFKPEQEAWAKERAQEHLVDLYIDQARWSDAFAVFEKETNFSGAELFLQAKIHFKQKNFALAKTQAETAFNRANLQGEYYASIESALLLAQLYKQLEQPDLQKNALDYIDKNASPSWKKDRQNLLSALINSN